jgi:hypothetical protein
MATLLTIVNSILEDLREDPAASVNANSYSKLIGKFVNRAKEDMEDINHEWSKYITSIDTTILNDGTRSYALTDTNDRSWLMRDWHRDWLPAAYDISSAESNRLQLCDIPLKELNRLYDMNADQNPASRPTVFAVEADTSNGGWKLLLLWGLDSESSNMTWRTYWYIPQDKLAVDGTDDSTEVLLPRNAVEARAYYYALNERGEEMGEPGGIAWTRSVNSIAASLENDLVVQKKSEENDITNKECL